MNNVSDICNSGAYSYVKDTYNLLLFADAASYVKSANSSCWTILSQLAELPPILRGSFENVVFHSSWLGSIPDFQLYLQKYNSEIDDLVLCLS